MSESWVGLAEMRLLAVCGCREPSLEADRFATAARLASGGGMLPALRPINQQIRHLPVPTLGSFRRIEWRGSQLHCVAEDPSLACVQSLSVPFWLRFYNSTISHNGRTSAVSPIPVRAALHSRAARSACPKPTLPSEKRASAEDFRWRMRCAQKQ